MREVIGVKVGSKAITDGNGIIYEKFIKSVCYQLAYLKRQEQRVFLVTSGAVACHPDKDLSRNLQAAIGQPRLFNIYAKHFNDLGVKAAQFLYTDHDLALGDTGISRTTLWESLFTPDVIPVINANDVVYSRELEALYYCSDNDVSFKLVCQLVDTDVALIGTPKAGLCGQNGEKMEFARREEYDHILQCLGEGNEMGYGDHGMRTKVDVSFELAGRGIFTMIVDTRQDNFILRGVQKRPEAGTIFL